MRSPPYQRSRTAPRAETGEVDEMLRAYQLLSADDPFRPQRLLAIAGEAETLGREGQALDLYRETYTLARATHDETTSAEALAGSARLYAERQEYKAALECYFECLELQNTKGGLTQTGNIWMMIGDVYSLLGELDHALHCFEQGMAKFSEGRNLYLEIKALANIANALRMKGEYAAALTPALRSLLVFEDLKDREGITEALALLGTIHERMGEFDTAQSFIERALAILAGNSNPDLRCALLLSLARLHYSAGHPRKALDTIKPALSLGRQIRGKQLCFQLHDVASAAYEGIGNLDEALRHHRIFVKLQSAYLRLTHRQYKSIADLKIHFNLEEAQRESDRYRDQVQGLRQEMYEKTRDMTTMSLDMMEKKAFIGEMKRQLSHIDSNSQEHSASLVKLLIEDITVTMKKEGGSAWKIFEAQFNEVHHDYLHLLTERYPTLTLAELKICALTRLDISTKEIAEMLFVSVRNVQNHRYRIRKKFGLGSKENLTTFLMGIQPVKP